VSGSLLLVIVDHITYPHRIGSSAMTSSSTTTTSTIQAIQAIQASEQSQDRISITGTYESV